MEVMVPTGRRGDFVAGRAARGGAIPLLLFGLALGAIIAPVGYAGASAAPGAWTTTYISSGSTSGCGHIGTLIGPSAVGRSIHFSFSANARSCAAGRGHAYKNSNVEWELGATENRSLAFSTGGSHWVNVTVRVTGKIDTHAYIARNCSGTPTSGPYSYAFLSCQATVGADYEDWVRVTDLTNGTLYTPAVPTGYYGILDFSGVEMGTTCYNGCSSYSYNLGANNSTRTSARASFDINLPNVNTSHAFQIELGVEGFILEIVDTAHFGFGHVKRLRGEVSGSVDLSAPRFGSTLVRVTVT